ncbi:MAG TPA: ribonuclease PH [Candidatus Limnocylindrales bacterium]|nr:ribonuclease PH [Candidatus Limnocylindrales bacterium]
MTRPDQRKPDELRKVTLARGWSKHPEGSVLVEFGDTRVLCTASVIEGVPRWRKGSGQGWVTAEYSMLPRATTDRSERESVKGKIGGRTHEISRLVGRALRACIELKALGENSILVDCDVLQADGGTRTAAITGAYVALYDAVTWMAGKNMLTRKQTVETALHRSVAAVSVGVIDGEPRLDLCYEEDARAQVDMNIVCTGIGDFVEVQGTGEDGVFDRDELNALLDLGLLGCERLTTMQREALGLPTLDVAGLMAVFKK